MTNETETITETTERVRLVGSGTFDDLATSIRALTFGRLVERAAPIVVHYRSDLYHDALWLAQWLTGPTTFYFACDDWGTGIGTDESLVRAVRPSNVWRVDVTCEPSGGRDSSDYARERAAAGNGTWFATYSRV